QPLGHDEVDDVTAELEAFFALKAVAAPRTAFDHTEPAPEQLPGSAPRAAPGHAPPQHPADRGLVCCTLHGTILPVWEPLLPCRGEREGFAASPLRVTNTLKAAILGSKAKGDK